MLCQTRAGLLACPLLFAQTPDLGRRPRTASVRAEPVEIQSEPVAWGEGERLKLRRDAEASKNEVELKPRQRVED